MKNRLFYVATFAILLVIVLSLSACGSSDASVAVTIATDGEEIAVDVTKGDTVAQILEKAEIPLNEGDVISIDPNQTIDEDLTISVLRRCGVIVESMMAICLLEFIVIKNGVNSL